MAFAQKKKKTEKYTFVKMFSQKKYFIKKKFKWLTVCNQVNYMRLIRTRVEKIFYGNSYKISFVTIYWIIDKQWHCIDRKILQIVGIKIVPKFCLICST